jgi:hypothetical protein
MKSMERVISVRTQEEFSLEITSSTGEVRLFDMQAYLDKGVFRRLRDVSLFRQAYVAFDTVCWPGDLDVAPETLYDRSHPAATAR